MQILFHLGAHCTDGGLLIRSILRNRAALALEGVGVPGPSRYRELLGKVSTSLRGECASHETESMLLEAICDDDSAERIILSNENFLCRGTKALTEDGLYPKVGKSAWLRNCFPEHNIEFAIATRNPATFVPDLVARLQEDDQTAILSQLHLDRLSWADMVAEIVEANPECPVIVWSHEDTPFIWLEILNELTACDPYTELDGALDMVEQIMSDEGMAKLTDFLSNHTELSEARRRTAISAFLDAHGIHDKIEEEIDVPGWTHDTIAHLSGAYDEDLAQIAKMPGVTFIEP
ncbi:MAG: hypothetical protein ACR2OY_14440 [Boseongicola sp.]